MDIVAHRTTPHISIDQYAKSRQIELGQSLDSRLPLYLDLNYWIALRKADSGCGNEAEKELLALLRELTRIGEIFCPISESVLLELMKQGDPQSRLRTAQLIDELSSGVALISFDARAATELSHFMRSSCSDPESLHPLHHLVWIRSSFALGFVHPSSAVLDAETNLAVQKAFFDEMWSMSLADLIKSTSGASPPESQALRNLATALNAGNAAHAKEIRSFSQAYVKESRGAASFFSKMAMQIAHDIAAKLNEPFPSLGSNEWHDQKRMWKSLLFQILQKKERTKLPSVHVHTCLHAAFRWDKSLRFEANDFYDFHHASAALAFCRAFFTERGLRSVITANHIGLDKLYNCDVIAGVPEAVEYLQTPNSRLRGGSSG